MELRRAERKDAAAISRVHAVSWKSGYRGMIDQEYLDGLREDHWVLPCPNGWRAALWRR